MSRHVARSSGLDVANGRAPPPTFRVPAADAERPIPLMDVHRLPWLPTRDDGTPPTRGTVMRWVRVGIYGVKLEATPKIRASPLPAGARCRQYTSAAELERFFDRLAALPGVFTPRQAMYHRAREAARFCVLHKNDAHTPRLAEQMRVRSTVVKVARSARNHLKHQGLITQNRPFRTTGRSCANGPTETREDAAKQGVFQTFGHSR